MAAKILPFKPRPPRGRPWGVYEARYLYNLREAGKWSQLVPFKRRVNGNAGSPTAEVSDGGEELLQGDS